MKIEQIQKPLDNENFYIPSFAEKAEKHMLVFDENAVMNGVEEVIAEKIGLELFNIYGDKSLDDFIRENLEFQKRFYESYSEVNKDRFVKESFLVRLAVKTAVLREQAGIIKDKSLKNELNKTTDDLISLAKKIAEPKEKIDTRFLREELIRLINFMEEKRDIRMQTFDSMKNKIEKEEEISDFELESEYIRLINVIKKEEVEFSKETQNTINQMLHNSKWDFFNYTVKDFAELYNEVKFKKVSLVYEWYTIRKLYQQKSELLSLKRGIEAEDLIKELKGIKEKLDSYENQLVKTGINREDLEQSLKEIERDFQSYNGYLERGPGKLEAYKFNDLEYIKKELEKNYGYARLSESRQGDVFERIKVLEETKVVLLNNTEMLLIDYLKDVVAKDKSIINVVIYGGYLHSERPTDIDIEIIVEDDPGEFVSVSGEIITPIKELKGPEGVTYPTDKLQVFLTGKGHFVSDSGWATSMWKNSLTIVGENVYNLKKPPLNNLIKEVEALVDSAELKMMSNLTAVTASRLLRARFVLNDINPELVNNESIESIWNLIDRKCSEKINEFDFNQEVKQRLKETKILAEEVKAEVIRKEQLKLIEGQLKAKDREFKSFIPALAISFFLFMAIYNLLTGQSQTIEIMQYAVVGGFIPKKYVKGVTDFVDKVTGKEKKRKEAEEEAQKQLEKSFKTIKNSGKRLFKEIKEIEKYIADIETKDTRGIIEKSKAWNIDKLIKELEDISGVEQQYKGLDDSKEFYKEVKEKTEGVRLN
ncbi:hypothetical protein KAI68_06500, partial [bacterium]|nr:hypothetical protein [bacterium]